jgi:hypothetical protein
MTLSPHQLIENQLSQWPLARKNYDDLKNVVRRKISDNAPDIYLQFNPNRILSSAAKVDAASIQARQCFLCPDNLPAQQLKVQIENAFQLLVNPYPIFNEHFTIPTLAHQPQRIKDSIGQMLDFSKIFSSLTLFYNGPKCGASAPDHLHFQAGNKGFLPIEADFESKRYCRSIINFPSITIWRWHNYLRPVFTFESNDKQLILNYFHKLHAKFASIQPLEDEPMLNIISYYQSDTWIVHVFPRRKHRPQQFFETGVQQILLSPASVDMGGVIILPREEDYHKTSLADIKDIFEQVCVSDEEMDILQKSLQINTIL